MDNYWLKSCPFCGKPARGSMCVTRMGGGEDCVTFTVQCTGCGVEKRQPLKITGYALFWEIEKAMQDVKDEWNTRACKEEEVE